jgi:hypothetical protein
VFLTSDAPVSSWTSPKNRHPFYGNGIAMSDEWAFAIDRRHAFVFAHEVSLGETFRDVGAAHVRELNQRTAVGARKFIIHHPDDNPLDGLALPRSQPNISISQEPRRIVPDGA